MSVIGIQNMADWKVYDIYNTLCFLTSLTIIILVNIGITISMPRLQEGKQSQAIPFTPHS